MPKSTINENRSSASPLHRSQPCCSKLNKPVSHDMQNRRGRTGHCIGGSDKTGPLEKGRRAKALNIPALRIP